MDKDEQKHLIRILEDRKKQKNSQCFIVFTNSDREKDSEKERIRNKILNMIKKETGMTLKSIDVSSKWYEQGKQMGSEGLKRVDKSNINKLLFCIMGGRW